MKGITPVISLILIIVLVCVLAALSFRFMTDVMDILGTKSKTAMVSEIEKITECVRIEGMNGNKIYLRNCGSTNLTDIYFYLDNKLISFTNETNGFNLTLSPGVGGFSAPISMNNPYGGIRFVNEVSVSTPGGLRVFSASDPSISGSASIYKKERFFVVTSDRLAKWYVIELANGTFGSPIFVEDKSGTGSWGNSMADFDNDGDNDFVGGDIQDGIGKIYIFYSNGIPYEPGVLIGNIDVSVPSVPGKTILPRIMDMATADFDNNGYMDFVVSGNNNIYNVFLNNKNRTFEQKIFSPAGGVTGMGKDAADFNNDGCKDIVADAYNDGRIGWFEGDCHGNFDNSGHIIAVSSAESYGVATGDFNNDGFFDIITNPSNTDNPQILFFKNTDNDFDQPVIVYSDSSLSRVNALDVFDFNMDGKLDMVHVTYNRNSAYWARGLGNGTFEYAGQISSNLGADVLGIATPRPFWR